MNRQSPIMEFMKKAHQIRLHNLPKELVEFSGKAIRARCLVMFHIKDCQFNFLLTEWGRQYMILLHRYLGYVIPQGLVHWERILYMRSKQSFIVSVIKFSRFASPTIIPCSCSNCTIFVFLCLPFTAKWKYLVLSSPYSNLVAFDHWSQ
jgi:hypothetical protein